VNEDQKPIPEAAGPDPELAARLEALDRQYRAAVDAYRARLQGMLPEAAELIAGDSVEDLDRAFEQARSLVERLRQQAAEAARREAVARPRFAAGRGKDPARPSEPLGGE